MSTHRQWYPPSPLTRGKDVVYVTITHTHKLVRACWVCSHCRWRSTKPFQWGAPGSGPESWPGHRSLQSAAEPGWAGAAPRSFCACLRAYTHAHALMLSSQWPSWPDCGPGLQVLTQHAQLSLGVPGVVRCERVDGARVRGPSWTPQLKSPLRKKKQTRLCLMVK